MGRGHTLIVEELLFGDTNRIRHVIRFSTCHRVRDENVAEHSYFTAFYAMMIARSVGLSDGEIGLLLQRSLIHDIDEAESGDFSRPFKYSNPELKKALDVAAKKVVGAVFSGMIPPEECDRLAADWELAKHGRVGKILEFADFLSVVAYVCGEIRGSNTTLRSHCKDLLCFYSRFEGKEWDFLRPLVEQAGEIVRREFRENKE